MTGLAGTPPHRGVLSPLRPSLLDGTAPNRGKLDTGKVRILGAPPTDSAALVSEPAVGVTPTAAPRFLLYSALVFSIFQFYVIPVGGVYFSLGLISAYSLIFLAAPNKATNLPVVRAIGALLLVEAASLIWSPNVEQGIREIVYTLPFLITFLAARQIAMRDESAIVGGLKLYCLAACLHSALIIGMTFAPSLKDLIFSSPAGGLFMSQNSLDALNSGTVVDNAAGSGKSGGFFDNANVAGVWAATTLATTIAVIHYSKSRLYILVALVHVAAIVACGSKASLALLALIPVAVVLVFMVFPPAGRRPQLFLAGMTATLVAGIGLVAREVLRQSQFATGSQETLTSRMVMWTHAWHEFQRTPWLGQGFGGWTLSFAPVGEAFRYLGVNPNFPPHNSLIILWSNSGLAAVLLGVVIVGLLLRIAMAPRRDVKGFRLAQCAFGAYLFVVAQAMGENYGILGEIHIQIPLAVLLGWASIYQLRPQAKA